MLVSFHNYDRRLTPAQDNPITSEGYNEEIANLIRELQLVDTIMVNPTPPSPDIRDMAKHLSMAQERLQSQILIEIEQNKTPNVI
jgi:hypothetical protein